MFVLSDEDDMDPITKQLWELAKNTPTKFALMYITDEKTGLTVEVDQSMDSSLGGKQEQMQSFLNEFLNIYFYWKNKKYNGEFDGKHKIKINHLFIDFGPYEGEKAWTWLTRYVKVVVELMNREGVINLGEIEKMLAGKAWTATEITTQMNTEVLKQD